MSKTLRVGLTSALIGFFIPSLCCADDNVFVVNNDTASTFDLWIINPATNQSARFLCPSGKAVRIGVPPTYGKRRLVAVSRRTGVQYELGWHDIREIVRDSNRSELKLSSATVMENKIVNGQMITTRAIKVYCRWISRGDGS
jgi:hypothetical protein